MRRFWTLLVVPAFALGCGEKHDGHDHNGHDHAAPSDADDALKGLSAADRALVKAQKVCPVSGDDLGSMGTPVKKTVGDEIVFLCCQGCVKAFDKDPQAYLAKVRK